MCSQKFYSVVTKPENYMTCVHIPSWDVKSSQMLEFIGHTRSDFSHWYRRFRSCCKPWYLSLLATNVILLTIIVASGQLSLLLHWSRGTALIWYWCSFIIRLSKVPPFQVIVLFFEFMVITVFKVPSASLSIRSHERWTTAPWLGDSIVTMVVMTATTKSAETIKKYLFLNIKFVIAPVVTRNYFKMGPQMSTIINAIEARHIFYHVWIITFSKHVVVRFQVSKSVCNPRC